MFFNVSLSLSYIPSSEFSIKCVHSSAPRPVAFVSRALGLHINGSHSHNLHHHEKLGCVFAVTITAMSILLLREGNFQVIVILK